MAIATLENRLENLLIASNANFEPKKMFGGIAFMIRGHMAVGVSHKGELMVRIDPSEEAVALKKKGARVMDFTGRPMHGFIFINETGTKSDGDIQYWIDLALKFNATKPIKTTKDKKTNKRPVKAVHAKKTGAAVKKSSASKKAIPKKAVATKKKAAIGQRKKDK